MSAECVEQWVVHNQWGSACVGTDLSEGLTVDGVWAWVNGSDPVQIASRQQYRPDDAMKMDATHRYTEHNELLYSMRAALASLGKSTMKRMHILASAYPLANASDAEFAGQVPAWLEKEEALTGSGRVVLHHDAEFFKPIEGQETDLTTQDIQEWRQAVIPSFNSLAVESQIHSIDDTASDQLVYFNDDFFTLRELAVSDYTTPLYGPVIKTLTRITSMYKPAENPIYRYINPAGEETGIKRAAWVLGMRFSLRPYYYITHHPRSLWLPLLREAAQTFPDAFSDTPLSRFRAQGDVPPSIQAVFLGTWYIVERHREALLWSWVVAKWGGSSETITSEVKDGMWAELADQESPPKMHIEVVVPIRVPVENVHTFKKAKVDVPTSTEYSFSSKDGYALSYVDALWYWDRPKHGYPDLTQGLIEENNGTTAGTDGEIRYVKDPTFKAAEMCTIVRSTCFGRSSNSNETANEFFKRIAFEQPKCGDCIVAALIGASGTAGIDKFLPDHDAEVPSHILRSESVTTPPHLPLTSDWTTTNFSMFKAIPKGSMKPGMTLREWCTRLIQRYSYVLGSTGSEFYKVERAEKLETELDQVQNQLEDDKEMWKISDSTDVVPTYQNRWRGEMGEERGPLAFLCLNDDIKEKGELRERVDDLLLGFFRKMWPGRMGFERRE